ncbi:MAG: AAA family ATPase [Candidatus Eisenbacteria bacterium]|nr:AAA family ATPase [Candidatus Eisenbacteria bacterium]
MPSSQRHEIESAAAQRGALEAATVSRRAQTSARERFDSVLLRVADRHAHCLWIAGAAGFGKTSVLRSLAATAEQRGVLVLNGLVPPGEEEELNWAGILADARPALPLTTIVASLDRASATRLRELFPWLPATEAAASNRVKLDAGQAQQAMTSALARLLEKLSQRLPVVLVLDDFARAGSTVLTQLQHLLHHLNNSSVLLVVGAQPGPAAVEEFRRGLLQRNRLTELELEPLSAADLQATLAEVVEPAGRGELSLWLHQATGGHPTFVRECLHALAQQGVLTWRTEVGRFAVTGDLTRAVVPDSLEAILQGRVAALDASDRAVFLALAALGGEAGAEAVTEMREGSMEGVRCALQRLEGLGLLEAGTVRPGERGRDPEISYRIRPDWLSTRSLEGHPEVDALRIRAAAVWEREPRFDPATRLSRRAWTLQRIGAVGEAERLEAHQQAAAANAEARHFGVARAHLLAGLDILDSASVGNSSRHDAEVALRLCESASMVLFATGPLPRAQLAVDRALELVREQPKLASRTRRRDLYINAARLYTRQGKYELAHVQLQQAIEAMGKSITAKDRGWIQFHKANAYYRGGDPASARALLPQVLSALDLPASRIEYCRARTLDAIVHWAEGRNEEALAICEDNLRRLVNLPSHPIEIDTCGVQALILRDLSRFDEMRVALERALSGAQELGLLWTEAVMRGIYGVLEQMLGHPAEAVRHHTTDLALRRALADQRGALHPRNNLAEAYAELGDLEEALELVREVVRESGELGLGSQQVSYRINLAGILHRMKRNVEALAEVEQAREAARTFQDPKAEAQAAALSARVLVALERPEEARAAIEVALAGTSLGPCDRAGFLVVQAIVLAGLGETHGSAARAAAQEAFRLFESVRAPARVVSARTELIAAGVLAPEPKPILIHREGEIGQRTVIQCFGPLHVVTADGRVLGPGDWGSNKARAIFAYLLSQRSQGGVPKEKLLEAIWPDSPWDSVEKTFHSTLAILRRVFPRGEGEAWAAVVQGGGCYALEFAGPVVTDAEEFDQVCREAAACEARGNGFFALDHYRRAVALYRGDYLEDSYLAWTDRLREHYRQAYSSALWRLGVLNLGAWRPAEALEAAQKSLAQDPLDERAHRLAMHAYVALGQRRAALEQYKKCALALKTELAAAPDPDTLDLARRIKAGEALPPV